MGPWLLALGLSVLEPIPVTDALRVAPGSCLQVQTLAESTASWLGRDTVDARTSVDVFAVSEARVAFRVWNDGAVAAERELPSPPADCAARTAAVGLLIALAIDEHVSEALGLPLPSPEALAPATASSPGHDPESAPRLEARRRPRVAQTQTPVGLVVAGIGSYEVVPGAGFGGRLGVSIRLRPHLDLDADVLGLGGLPFSLGDGETQPSLVAAAVGLCPGIARGRVGARLCLSPWVGVVVASGRGYPQDERVVLPWLGARTSADLRVALSPRVALTFDVGVVAPLVGARFDVRNEGGILQERRAPAAAGGSGGVGVVVQLRDPHGSG